MPALLAPDVDAARQRLQDATRAVAAAIEAGSSELTLDSLYVEMLTAERALAEVVA